MMINSIDIVFCFNCIMLGDDVYMSTVGVHVDSFSLKCIDNHPIITNSASDSQVDASTVCMDEKKHEQHNNSNSKLNTK